MRQRLIDIGGYRLDLRSAGDGVPTVVCLSSAGGAHEQWARLVPLISDATTVATYGRPKLGDSDPLPEALRGLRGAAWPAGQLRALLAAAAIPPPYVLATGSIGGYIADQYAARWPDEIAGVVWIDPSPPRNYPGVYRDRDVIEDADEPGGLRINRPQVFAEQRAHVPTNCNGRFVVLSAAVGRWLRTEPRDWHQPLTLAEVDFHWVKMQREWAKRLDAVQIVADRSGHLVHFEQPELAAAVVREVVDATRAGRPVAFNAAELAAVGAKFAGPAGASHDGGAGARTPVEPSQPEGHPRT